MKIHLMIFALLLIIPDFGCLPSLRLASYLKGGCYIANSIGIELDYLNYFVLLAGSFRKNYLAVVKDYSYSNC